METAAPLKSEIGDGRRRLLFRDAVAAMPLFLFFFQKNSKPGKYTNKREKDGTLFASDGWLSLKLVLQSVLMEHTKTTRNEVLGLGWFWHVWRGAPALSCVVGCSPLLSSVHMEAF
jgi:hypothetical protein